MNITIFKIRDSRQLRSLTGIDENCFNKTGKRLDEILEKNRQKAYEKAVKSGMRKRKTGGGRKAGLPTTGDKLLFFLFYLKVYTTYDVLGAVFGMGRSAACENFHGLFPVFFKTLSEMNVLPRRSFRNAEEIKKTFENEEHIIIDVTERPHHRPKNDEKQRAMYSGKKKGIWQKTP